MNSRSSSWAPLQTTNCHLRRSGVNKDFKTSIVELGIYWIMQRKHPIHDSRLTIAYFRHSFDFRFCGVKRNNEMVHDLFAVTQQDRRPSFPRDSDLKLFSLTPESQVNPSRSIGTHHLCSL